MRSGGHDESVPALNTQEAGYWHRRRRKEQSCRPENG